MPFFMLRALNKVQAPDFYSKKQKGEPSFSNRNSDSLFLIEGRGESGRTWQLRSQRQGGRKGGTQSSAILSGGRPRNKVSRVAQTVLSKVIGKFSAHGKRKGFEQRVVDSVYMLKVWLRCKDIYGRLNKHLSQYKPYIYIYQPSLKRYVRSFKKRPMFVKYTVDESKRSSYCSRLVYESIIKRRGLLKCKLATAILFELYLVVKFPRRAGAFKLLKRFVEAAQRIRRFRRVNKLTKL